MRSSVRTLPLSSYRWTNDSSLKQTKIILSYNQGWARDRTGQSRSRSWGFAGRDGDPDNVPGQPPIPGYNNKFWRIWLKMSTHYAKSSAQATGRTSSLTQLAYFLNESIPDQLKINRFHFPVHVINTLYKNKPLKICSFFRKSYNKCQSHSAMQFSSISQSEFLWEEKAEKGARLKKWASVLSLSDILKAK